jgi:hypothetical protein
VDIAELGDNAAFELSSSSQAATHASQTTKTTFSSAFFAQPILLGGKGEDWRQQMHGGKSAVAPGGMWTSLGKTRLIAS